MRFQIRLLGRMEVDVGAAALPPVSQRKARALLAYLALAPRREASRETLSALLWGDRDERRARASLRQALWALRRHLDAHAPGLLHADAERVSLPSACTDVEAFERLCRGTSQRELVEGVRLYRGELLEDLTVAEEPFEAWRLGERLRLERVAADALERLAALQIDDGAPGAAVTTGRRLLALDPVRESGHRLLMRALAGSGQRSAALAHYASCQRVLAETLGVKPDDETRRLHDAIRTGAAAPRTAPSGAPALSDPPALERAPGPRASGGLERRQVTVMRCALADPTADGAEMDAEAYREILLARQAAAAAAVAPFAGHVARQLEDGLLVYFGYPEAHEDDAERAVRAGLAVLGAAARPPVASAGAVRIGIATGVVVAGEVWGDSQEAVVLGGARATAEQLLHRAAPDTVRISTSTADLVTQLFELQPVAGRRAARAYRVVAEMPRPTRFAGRASRRLTPFVGRQEELGLLTRRWSQVRTGRGRATLVVGEAGIGKSRLLHELTEALREPHAVMALQCSPYLARSPLHPLIGELERVEGLAKADRASAGVERLRRRLGKLGDVDEKTASALAELLSIPVATELDAAAVDARRRREEILRALLDYVRARATRSPLLCLVEDVHWGDPTTQELLARLVDRIEDAPILLLVTARPGFTAAWTDLAHCSVLGVSRLGRDAARQLARAVASGLPDAVLEEVASRSEGNPLFLEELARAIEAGRDIPTTLRDSLMARLDRLGSGKGVAQTASVIGREFDEELLAATSDASDGALSAGLRALLEAELVFRKGPGEFAFKHVLVRDAAYESLPGDRRRHLHGRAAAVLAGRAAVEPDEVASHYAAAGQDEAAAAFWQRAGERAARRAATAEAEAHFREAIAAVERLPDTRELTAQEVDLRLALGIVEFWTGRAGSADHEANYARARARCESLSDPRRMFPAVWGLWFSRQLGRKYVSASELSDDLLSMAGRSDDASVRLQAHHAAWTTQFCVGRPQDALGHVEAGLAIYDPERHGGHAYLYGGHDPGVCGHIAGAMSAWITGDPERAARLAEEGIALAEALETVASRMLGRWGGGFVYQFRDEPERCAQMAAECLELAEAHGMSASPAAVSARILQCWAAVRQGRGEGMAALMRSALDAPGANLFRPYYAYLLADALARLGRRAEALGPVVAQLDREIDAPELGRARRLLADLS